MNVRKQIYKIIDIGGAERRLSILYDRCMMLIILLSLAPLTVKNPNNTMIFLDKFTAGIFIADYLLRWITADYSSGLPKKEQKKALFLYPFRFFAIIDLLAILPTLTPVNQAFKLLRLFRLLKFLHYLKTFNHILEIIKRERKSLMSVGAMAVMYILISALVMFSVEPDTFSNVFEAIYWAATALTTVGYGDIYPITPVGKLVSVISSFLGIALVALPSGIITAGFMKDFEQK